MVTIKKLIVLWESSDDPSKTYNSNIEKMECWYKNGGCWQYCEDTEQSRHVICSCALGYTLSEDGKKCTPSGNGEYLLTMKGGFRLGPKSCVLQVARVTQSHAAGEGRW